MGRSLRRKRERMIRSSHMFITTAINTGPIYFPNGIPGHFGNIYTTNTYTNRWDYQIGTLKLIECLYEIAEIKSLCYFCVNHSKCNNSNSNWSKHKRLFNFGTIGKTCASTKTALFDSSKSLRCTSYAFHILTRCQFHFFP